MFGISLSKILFTLVAIAVIWYGAKWGSRLQQYRKKSGYEPVGGDQRPGRGVKPEELVEEMTACKTCGVFISARNVIDCGKDNCPYAA